MVISPSWTTCSTPRPSFSARRRRASGIRSSSLGTAKVNECHPSFGVHRRNLPAAIVQRAPNGFPSWTWQLTSASFPALAPAADVDGAVLDGDVAGLQVHHFGPSPLGEDEHQQDGLVPSCLDGVGRDIEDASDLVGGIAPSWGRTLSWTLDEVTRVRGHEAHADEEAEVASPTSSRRPRWSP
jgi:hypothetical protein